MKNNTAALCIFAATLALATTAASAALDDATALESMKKGGCNACHTIERKVVGPSYKEVAQKRKSDAGAVASLEKKVREGGKGEYGTIPMPPNPAAKISDAEIHELVAWILTK